jgi:hypothetical protein
MMGLSVVIWAKRYDVRVSVRATLSERNNVVSFKVYASTRHEETWLSAKLTYALRALSDSPSDFRIL